MLKKNQISEPDITEMLGLENSSSSAGKARKWFLLTIPIVMVICALFILLPGNNAQTMQFKTQPVVRGDLTLTIHATGNLEPTNQVDVGSELSGIIEDKNNLIKINKEKLTLKEQQIENHLKKIKKQEKYISLLLKKIELLEKENKSLKVKSQ